MCVGEAIPANSDRAFERAQHIVRRRGGQQNLAVNNKDANARCTRTDTNKTIDIGFDQRTTNSSIFDILHADMIFQVTSN